MIRREVPRPEPRQGGPYTRLDFGGEVGVIVLRIPIDSDARRAMAYYSEALAAYLPCQHAVTVAVGRAQAAERARAAAAPDDVEATEAVTRELREVEAERLEALAGVEAAAGYLLLRAWADPVWELETEPRYLAHEFAGAEDPAGAAGRAVALEVHDVADNSAAVFRAVANWFHEKLHPNPSPAEVKREVDFSDPPTDTKSG